MRSNSFQLAVVLAFVFGFAIFSFGQEKSNSIDCKSYRFPTDNDYKRAKVGGTEAQGGVFFYLKKFVEQCPDSPSIQQAKQHFAISLEERAETSLYIAKFYLKQYEEKQTGLKGAWARLREVIEKYPQFSKLDEALFLLIKANLYLDRLEGKNYEENLVESAKKTYKRLLAEFPFSPYICEANKLFQPTQNK
ncbi:MAG: outer membrane protein assembly factor BamD [Pyrinomonadaceae bacterium]|nr:outer membrane protein assembly factor BamD [Pyrinomonadaceae bacterium]